ncbi:MAG TPA: hypothetical protein VK870_08160 [Ignavibacteriaceae bacterium]|nr:hypothetical protein [Ignavibacteriaceae bacterium]
MKIGDSELARWLQIDPMSSQRPGLTYYNYCQNNPLIRINPTGEYKLRSDIDILLNDE